MGGLASVDDLQVTELPDEQVGLWRFLPEKPSRRRRLRELALPQFFTISTLKFRQRRHSKPTSSFTREGVLLGKDVNGSPAIRWDCLLLSSSQLRRICRHSCSVRPGLASWSACFIWVDVGLCYCHLHRICGSYFIPWEHRLFLMMSAMNPVDNLSAAEGIVLQPLDVPLLSSKVSLYPTTAKQHLLSLPFHFGRSNLRT